MRIGSSRLDRRARRLLTAGVWWCIAGPLAAEAQVLHVRVGDGWHPVFDAAQPRQVWQSSDPTLQASLRWQPARAAGIEYAEATLSGAGEAWRIRLIMVRVDPARVTLRTVTATTARTGSAAPQWTLRNAPADAIVALNAGQFEAAGPWGWVVRGGMELEVPGHGPLAMAFAVDKSGAAHLMRGDSLEALRRSGTVLEGFQSWPYLLADGGQLPVALRDSSLGVRLQHRDARLALGKLRDGRLLIALTRFIGLGDLAEMVPFGLTTPEMAAVMGAMGCQEAMLLDGGISSQLLIRTRDQGTKRWPGLRPVPLALVVGARR